MDELTPIRKSVQHHPALFRLYRSCEQAALHARPKLTPDQWSRLIAALAAFAKMLLEIWGGGQAASPEEKTPPK